MLSEYEVGSLSVNVSSLAGHSIATVVVPLYGRFWFYVTASYIPTMMLMFIGE